ncbi:glycosyltransferase [Pontibacter silvestris]|uniref:Glycosyltransferase n=1 Tax=Pontibacter silvestris TaxID=2305183 RepID=A0ABW4WUQ3_9BACT|nr:glycosyltransferase [Pontibacter silvestris]MCC9138625.1 glycosyltransferase [Pontibacter silvestris]
MSEKRILLASLLKPVNDTRMYEKLGLSLAKLKRVQVHICGYKAPVPTNAPDNVIFHPAFHFKRLSPGRIKAQYTFFKLLLKVKPEIIICSTHEFLIVSCIFKLKKHCNIIYDVQENYSLNLKSQHNYTTIVKHTLAALLRTIEKVTAPGIAHFILAERSYAQELSFLDNKYTIIENKYKAQALSPATPVQPDLNNLRLLFSGTISEVYGIFEAITFADALYQVNPETHLTIIGYCPLRSTLQKVKKLIQHKPYISLIGGDVLVPHQQILDQIRKSNLGILPYQPNKSTFRCIPTKLYEYAALGLPMLVQNNPLWQSLISKFKAGLVVDFRQVDIQALLQELQQQQFYTAGTPNDALWESEEIKLLQVVSNFIH